MTQNIKTVLGVAIASVKTFEDITNANTKTWDGVDNTSGGGSTPFITNVSGDGASLFNFFDGCLGFYFTVGASNITVTDVARWKTSGNSGMHTVKILDSSAVVVVSITVDLSSGSAGTYVYGSVTPTVLTAGATYYCFSSESNGGDAWNDYATTTLTTTTAAVINAASYQPNCSGAPNLVPGQHSYVPTNFKYF